MGFPLTNSNDYKTGRFALPVNKINVKDLIADISDRECELLECLLGVELTSLLIDDLDFNNVPQSDRFVKIWDKFQEEIKCKGKIRSRGILDMIKSFVFFYNGRRRTNCLTIAGSKKTDSENSDNTKLSSTELISSYNRGVNTHNAIVEYICMNEDTYPEFVGEYRKVKSFI